MTADPHALQRFVAAQEPALAAVRAELRAGRKRTHWMWFVFPQLAGLGTSATAQRYAIASLQEARAYLAHPLLGARLRECVALLLGVPDRSAYAILGAPDDRKLQSCLTLFALAAPHEPLWREGLRRFYDGALDARTVALLDHAGDSLAPRPLRELALSAASGLVLAGAWLYLVADDEHHLGVLPRSLDGPLALHRLFPGALPEDPADRKRRKPDLEALAWLPPWPGQPQGALLACGSGSRPNRERGVLLPLDPAGAIAGAAREIDLHALYAPLHAAFGDLNLEGAFVEGGALHLLQRAHQGNPRNAAIAFPLAEVCGWLDGTREPPAGTVTEFDLGRAEGVALGFTDGTAWPGGGWVFSAVAEDTTDSYADGRCAASVLGWVQDGTVRRIARLTGAPKVEGVACDGTRLLLVTDADDRAVPSRLLALPLP